MPSVMFETIQNVRPWRKRPPALNGRHVDRALARSAPWAPVMQASAGANWGQVFTPRHKTEVLADFEDGLIDRPARRVETHQHEIVLTPIGAKNAGRRFVYACGAMPCLTLERVEWLRLGG